jgi:hypothetical protein
VLTTSGVDDIFLLKFTNIGTPVWAKRAGGTDYDYPSAMAVDNTGNIFLTGSFIGAAFFDAQPLVSAGNDDMFLVRYNTNGNAVWMHSGGGSGFDGGYGITFDNNGKLYVCGGFSSTANFGSQMITSASGLLEDIFIARYDLNGNIEWVRRGGGVNADIAYGMVADVTGNAYVTGSFYNAINFGNNLISNGSSDFFLARFNPLLVGVDEWPANGSKFVMYPNPLPAGQTITVLLNSADKYTIYIFDALGRRALQEVTVTGLDQYSVNIQDIPPGMYQVCLESEGTAIRCEKLIVF